METPKKVDYHMHSSYSNDGKNSPEEIVKYCIEKSYFEICIVDHIRKNTEWVPKFANEIRNLKKRYAKRIKILSGIEANVIDLDGNIDAKPEFVGQVDFVCAAFHRIPASDGFLSTEEIISKPQHALFNWYIAMKSAITNPYVSKIAHPTAILKRYGIFVPKDYKREISKLAATNNKVFEFNSRYCVPDYEFLQYLKRYGVQIDFGSNSHSIAELNNSTILIMTKGGGKNEGIGHIMRCINISKDIRKKWPNIKIIFLIKDNLVGKKLIKNEGFKLISLPSFGNNIEKIKRVIQENSVKLILTDIYGDTYKVVLEIRKLGKPILSITNIGNYNVPADIILNHYIGFDNGCYINKYGSKCLLGPQYTLLNPNFRELPKYDPLISKKVNQILVTIGGEDEINLTTKLIKPLSKISNNINIVLLIGPAFNYEKELTEEVSRYKKNFEIKQHITDISDIAYDSDIVISGAGNTLYELCSIGKPVIAICLEKHQRKIAMLFEEKCCIINLGMGEKLDNKKVTETVENIINDFSLRQQLSKTSKTIVNPIGIEAIEMEICTILHGNLLLPEVERGGN